VHRTSLFSHFRHIVGALLLTGSFAIAHASTIIDFQTATTGFHSLSNNPYTENGFTVTALSGAWSVVQNSPNIFVEDNNLNTNAIEVTDGGADFTFSSVDLEQSGSGYHYTITGFLGGTQVLIQGGSPGTFDTFKTVNSINSSQPVDTLRDFF